MTGLHRLEAVKLLGWTEVACSIAGLDELTAKLAELDENFTRTNLSPLEAGGLYRRRKDLMGTFLSSIVPQVLSFVAENVRTNIRQRQAEGIAAAKARGVRFGRPPGPLPENCNSACQRWKAGTITCTAAAKECGMPLSTFRYRAKIYENAKLL